MNSLYKKSEITFAVIWILIYVIGDSVAENLSIAIGMEKSITFVFNAIITLILIFWLNRNRLFLKYGLCMPSVSADRLLYYLPLVFIASCNLWFGVRMNLSVSETLFFIGSMLLVGFLEELIFRGFLFKAMCKDGVKSAVIVSSITFGIGHIVNLFNGSGMSVTANLCQICSAIAIGLMFVMIFYTGKSLLPCILTHSILNSLSVFANAPDTAWADIAVSAVITIAAVWYTLFIIRNYKRA